MHTTPPHHTTLPQLTDQNHTETAISGADAVGLGASSRATAGHHAVSTDAARPRKHTRRGFLLAAGGELGLAAAGTSAWALDHYVVDHVEITDTEAYEVATPPSPTAAPAAARPPGPQRPPPPLPPPPLTRSASRT